MPNYASGAKKKKADPNASKKKHHDKERKRDKTEKTSVYHPDGTKKTAKEIKAEYEKAEADRRR
eukprot:SAG22_NODE_749_length_7484_cov_3.144347_6_plen_64_part_00